MKPVLMIALAGVLYSAPVAAENRIELYADINRTTCSIVEPTSPPVVQLHVFVTGTVPTAGVRFKAPKPDCWVGATWLGDAVQPGVAGLGSSQNDWSVAWMTGAGGCTSANNLPFYIGAISYLISGQAEACCTVDALPAGQFVWVDCEFNEFPLAPSKSIVVNPDESCGCQGGITTAVETSTWGKVKSLYR